MGYKYTCLLIAIILVVMMPLVVAQPVYERETNVTLSIPCTVDGEYCGAGTVCNTTIINPEQEVLFNNAGMTQVGAVFEIDLSASQTDTNGEYEFNVACCDGNDCFSKSLTFVITPNGEIPTTAKGILYVGLLVVFLIFFGLCLYGGKEAKGVVGRSAFYLVAYLFVIGIVFLAWNLSLDYLTSAPFMASFFRIIFLFLMYALFPLLMVLTFYTMWMMKKIDVIQKMIDKGIPEDEAYGRTVKSGFGGKKQW